MDGVSEALMSGAAVASVTGVVGGAPEEDFFGLMQELDEVEGIDRYRISSIEPNLLTPEMIEWVAGSRRFMPHFHIPLQSGSDRILGLMRRRYKRDLYAERVQLIKQLMPHCAIGVDVIVGFPGESEEDFMETFGFLQELDVSYLHVFTYSERDHTRALEIRPIVPIARSAMNAINVVCATSPGRNCRISHGSRRDRRGRYCSKGMSRGQSWRDIPITISRSRPAIARNG